MGTIYCDVQGIKLLSEASAGGTGAVAEITVQLGAYSTGDNAQLGGTSGALRGTSTSATLATLIQNQRRDGKTVTIGNPDATNTSVAICAESGKQGSTEFWAGSFAVSSGNITFNVANTSGTEVAAASGIYDRPLKLLVSYRVA